MYPRERERERERGREREKKKIVIRKMCKLVAGGGTNLIIPFIQIYLICSSILTIGVL